MVLGREPAPDYLRVRRCGEGLGTDAALEEGLADAFVVRDVLARGGARHMP